MTEKVGFYKKLQEHLGLIASIVGISTGVAGVFGYQFGTTATTEKFQEHNELSRQKLNNIIDELPEDKKEIYAPLINSIADITQASTKDRDQDIVHANINAATSQIEDFIKSSPIVDYNVTKSPFALSVGKSVLLCDNTFSVGYPQDNFSKGPIWLNVHRTKLRRYNIGSHIIAKEGLRELELIPMEKLPAQKALVLSFTCK